MSARAEDGGFREPERSVHLSTWAPEAQKAAICRPGWREYHCLLTQFDPDRRMIAAALPVPDIAVDARADQARFEVGAEEQVVEP